MEGLGTVGHRCVRTRYKYRRGERGRTGLSSGEALCCPSCQAHAKYGFGFDHYFGLFLKSRSVRE